MEDPAQLAQDPASQPAASPAARPPAAEAGELAVGLADTPAGQRLAVQLTLMLGADEAKALAAQLADAAGSMSTTRLVIANGVLHQ